MDENDRSVRAFDALEMKCHMLVSKKWHMSMTDKKSAERAVAPGKSSARYVKDRPPSLPLAKKSAIKVISARATWLACAAGSPEGSRTRHENVSPLPKILVKWIIHEDLGKGLSWSSALRGSWPALSASLKSCPPRSSSCRHTSRPFRLYSPTRCRAKVHYHPQDGIPCLGET
jgi:hypothetical protein